MQKLALLAISCETQLVCVVEVAAHHTTQQSEAMMERGKNGLERCLLEESDGMDVMAAFNTKESQCSGPKPWFREENRKAT